MNCINCGKELPGKKLVCDKGCENEMRDYINRKINMPENIETGETGGKNGKNKRNC